MQQLKIDSDFEALLPPSPTSDEAIEQQLVAEGIQRPITVWKGKGIIVDGHRRYRAAQKRGLPFVVQEIELPDKLAALAWIVNNQLAPRNLSALQEAQVRAKLVEIETKTRGESRIMGVNVAQRVAARTGVTERTVHRSVKQAEALKRIVSSVRRAIESGDIKASIKDIEELADLPDEHQLQVLKEFRNGNYKNLGEILNVEGPVDDMLEKPDSQPAEDGPMLGGRAGDTVPFGEETGLTAPTSPARKSTPRRPAGQLFEDLTRALGQTKKLADELSHAKPGPDYQRLMDVLDRAGTVISEWKRAD